MPRTRAHRDAAECGSLMHGGDRVRSDGDGESTGCAEGKQVKVVVYQRGAEVWQENEKLGVKVNF